MTQIQYIEQTIQHRGDGSTIKIQKSPAYKRLKTLIPLLQRYTRKCVGLTKECVIELAKNVLQIKSTLQILSPSRASAPTLLNSTQPQNLRNCSNKLEVLTMWFCFRYDFQEDNNALRWCSLEEGHLFLSSRLGQAITNTSWSKQGQSILEMDVRDSFFRKHLHLICAVE